MAITKRKPPSKEQNVAAVRRHRNKCKNLKTTHPTMYERKLRLRARSKRNYRHRKAVRDDPKQALVRVKKILKKTDEENLNKSMFEEFFGYQCVSVYCQGDVDELKKHYRGHDLGGELNEQLDVLEVDRIVEYTRLLSTPGFHFFYPQECDPKKVNVVFEQVKKTIVFPSKDLYNASSGVFMIHGGVIYHQCINNYLEWGYIDELTKVLAKYGLSISDLGKYVDIPEEIATELKHVKDCSNNSSDILPRSVHDLDGILHVSDDE